VTLIRRIFSKTLYKKLLIFFSFLFLTLLRSEMSSNSGILLKREGSVPAKDTLMLKSRVWVKKDNK